MQHQTSTLRILISFMRGVHQVVFSDQDAEDTQFWETLFFELTPKWKAASQYVLHYRFSWVLEYLQTGALPQEATKAQEIMRDALQESLLAKTKHPYSYDVGVSKSGHLHPDLDTVWIQELLKSECDIPRLVSRLKHDLPSVNFLALCTIYGILIPQLWEQTVLQLKEMVDRVCQQAGTQYRVLYQQLCG
ncbi:hypothetical protein CEP51_007538 [Fusarium floridanum]|uniref:Uncharacterized protein n=1 Tax=Fusarium floridanum TaxID=1325733 RepID=A0A428RP25_9HYPO|nr:hypothetical protein CEP51_007538 [Fusarium floridanum]